jgi:hypothetical protein
MHPSTVTPWVTLRPTRGHALQMLGFRVWIIFSRRKGCFLNPKPCSTLPTSFGSYKVRNPTVTPLLLFSFCTSRTSFYSTLLNTCTMLRFFLLLLFSLSSFRFLCRHTQCSGFQYHLYFVEAVNSTLMFAVLNVQGFGEDSQSGASGVGYS